jgi:hypothetical protein
VRKEEFPLHVVGVHTELLGEDYGMLILIKISIVGTTHRTFFKVITSLLCHLVPETSWLVWVIVIITANLHLRKQIWSE